MTHMEKWTPRRSWFSTMWVLGIELRPYTASNRVFSVLSGHTPLPPPCIEQGHVTSSRQQARISQVNLTSIPCGTGEQSSSTMSCPEASARYGQDYLSSFPFPHTYMHTYRHTCMHTHPQIPNTEKSNPACYL